MNEDNPADDEPIMATLVSLDDQQFELPYKAAILSELVRDSLSGVQGEDDDEIPDENLRRVDLLRVNGATLERVVKFLQHHADEPMQEIPVPFSGTTFNAVMRQEWYQNFCATEFENDRTVLRQLMAAANYMHIKPLLDLTVLRMTFQMQDMNREQIRQYLDLPALTPEEERQAREDYPWIFEYDEE